MVKIGGTRETNLGLKVENYQTSAFNLMPLAKQLTVQLNQSRNIKPNLKTDHFQSYHPSLIFLY